MHSIHHRRNARSPQCVAAASACALAPTLSRRELVHAAMLLGASSCVPAIAGVPPSDLSVGALRLASAGPLYIAQHERYFDDEGLRVQIRYFDAAQPIALAVTAGDIDLGLTAMTAGFFNIAGKGTLKVIAGQAAIVKGQPGDVLMASRSAFQRRLKRAADLPGHTIGITQVGSSFHYELGLFAQTEGFDIQRVNVRPLQSVSNMMAALKTGQIDSAIVSPQAAAELAASGEAIEIARVGDAGEYRFGALFGAKNVLERKKDAVRRFVAAYRRGAAAYNVAFFGSGARRTEIAYMIAQHIMPNEAPTDHVARLVAQGAYYVDADAPLVVQDIARQLAWFEAAGFVEPGVKAEQIIDRSFAR